jgi:hypothetical protein
MQREIARRFARNDLNPSSQLIELPHIGEYLYKRILRKFAPNNRIITIRGFARRIQNMNINTLITKLQEALQNKRNNQCIQTNTNRFGFYHVPDYNLKGWESMISLIKVLNNGRDGYALGNNFSFDIRQLRMPRRRDENTKYASCLSPRQCRRSNNVYHNGLCQPHTHTIGFQGVRPYSGQKIKSNHNSRLRGHYAASPNRRYLWRHAGRMRKV